jgi:hypothetical protein
MFLILFLYKSNSFIFDRLPISSGKNASELIVVEVKTRQMLWSWLLVSFGTLS